MIALTLWATAAHAQTADDRWHTIRTEHFRVHYPDQASAFAEDAAAHLEAWHARVQAEVGWIPARTIDAIVIDPYSDANGYALPFGGAPRTAWFTTPPEASSEIGYFRKWDEELIVHEDTHLAHLTRPPRNAGERILFDLFGFSPVAPSPRWVIEGYATVVEGRLTGFGRPNGDGRAILLRSLAQRGALPTYGELNGNAKWAGGSYAYLVGSAYLEWLEQRAGAGSLRNLWARMTAKETRSFDEAFEGVFGDTPAVLYGRFCAELTASAMAIEAAEPPQDHLFQKLGWSVTSADVSPDGAEVAVARFPRTGAPEIEVYDLAVDQKAVDKREKAIQDEQEADPEDVAPVAPAHQPHERAHVRKSAGFAAREVRWAPDGKSLVFSAWTPDGRGRLRPDLYRWTIGGRTERITKHADLRTPDPSSDGSWIAAVRLDWGQTQLVRVDLGTGDIVPLTPLSLDQVDQPRISPDGKRLAWIQNQRRGNGVVVEDLETGELWQSSPGGGLVAFSLAWSADGRALLATGAEQGYAEIWEIWRDGGQGRGRLSATQGVAVAADPIDATSALALRPTEAGLDLVQVALKPQGPLPSAGSAPARRPIPPEAPPIPDPVPVTPRSYGLGHQDLSLFAGVGYAVASRQGQVEFAARMGDVAGRSMLLAMGAYAVDTGGTYGSRLSWTYAGLPVRLGLDGWLTGNRSYGDFARDGFGIQLDREASGVSSRISGRVAALYDGGGSPGTRALAYVGASAGAAEPSRGWFGASVSLRGDGGILAGEDYAHGVAAGTIQLLSRAHLLLGYEIGASTGTRTLDRFALGGLASSLNFAPGQLWQVVDPAYAAGSAYGRWEDRATVSIGGPVELYGERRRVDDVLGSAGFSSVGIRSIQQVPPTPMGRLPSITTDFGVACRVEFPGLGFDRQPCEELSDYTFWASLVFGR